MTSKCPIVSDADINRTVSLDEMYTFPEPSSVNASRYASTAAQGESGGSWYGDVKRSKAVQFASSYTLPETAAKLLAKLTEDLPVFTNASKRRARHSREDGDYVSDYASYEAFRQGVSRDVRFWSDMHRQERRQTGVVTLGVNVSSSSGQDQMELEYRGAAVLALSDYLEALGYRTGIVALVGGSHGSWLENTAVEVKSPAGLLSQNGMAFVCHLGTWRHFYLAYLASLPKDVGMGYGGPRDYAGPVEVDVTAPIAIRNERDATSWLTATIAKLKERGE